MKYMLLIYGPDAAPTGSGSLMPDPAPWVGYTQWLVDKGIYRGGEPLASVATATTVRVRDGQRSVTDGPFAETKEVLGGYYVVECDDLDLAIEAAARCPGAATGSMEVRPLGEMPGRPGDAPA
jgi:hypothetical protein